MVPRKKKMYEVIMSKIEEFLLEKGLKPGDKLPSERELAENFNVSRTSVREALGALAHGGLIEIRQRGGSYLKSPDVSGVSLELSKTIIENEKHRIYEMLELRRVLEVESASLAAQRARTEDLEKIRKALEAMNCPLDDVTAGVAADLAFHISIVEATHNSIFIQLIQSLNVHMEDTIRATRKHRFMDEARYEETFEEHKSIYLAIATGQPEQAKKLMEMHILRVRRELSEAFIVESDKK